MSDWIKEGIASYFGWMCHAKLSVTSKWFKTLRIPVFKERIFCRIAVTPKCGRNIPIVSSDWNWAKPRLNPCEKLLKTKLRRNNMWLKSPITDTNHHMAHISGNIGISGNWSTLHCPPILSHQNWTPEETCQRNLEREHNSYWDNSPLNTQKRSYNGISRSKRSKLTGRQWELFIFQVTGSDLINHEMFKSKNSHLTDIPQTRCVTII